MNIGLLCRLYTSNFLNAAFIDSKLRAVTLARHASNQQNEPTLRAESFYGLILSSLLSIVIDISFHFNILELVLAILFHSSILKFVFIPVRFSDLLVPHLCHPS